jgi:hypothetical protein
LINILLITLSTIIVIVGLTICFYTTDYAFIYTTWRSEEKMPNKLQILTFTGSSIKNRHYLFADKNKVFIFVAVKKQMNRIGKK